MKYLSQLCDLCGICTAVCPFDAVINKEGRVLFLGSCTQCDLCARACPAGAILQDEEEREDRWPSFEHVIDN